VLVPDHLKSYASLATKVVVAGIHNRIELWNEEAWNKYTNGVEKEANVLAQKLADIGMI
jgi:MraZ protein